MNYHLTCSSAILCSFLASGCSTYTLKQTEKVSASAGIYTKHLNELLDKTRERVISMDSKDLAASRSIVNQKENEKKLKENNEALAKWLVKVAQVRKQNDVLLNYFQTLEKMMKPSANSSDLGTSLGDISQSISGINQTTAKQQGQYSQSRQLNETEAQYVGSLGQMIVSNRHSSKVREALLRDSKIIDRQLELQNKQLKEISVSYKSRTNFANRDHYTNQVVGSYIDVTQPRFNATTWAQSRLTWLNSPKEMGIFEKIHKANKAFRKDWRALLLKKKDVTAVKSILGEVSSSTRNAYYLHQSRQDTTPNVTTNLNVIPQN